MMNVIKNRIAFVLVLSAVVVSNATLVSCGDSKVDPDAPAKKVPSTLNTTVVGDKVYGGSSFTTKAFCSGDMGMIHESLTAQGSTTIRLGGNEPTGTKTYKVVLPSSADLSDNEATIRMVLYEAKTNPVAYIYTSVFADAGTLTVTIEGGKKVARYSGVTAKVYNIVTHKLPTTKEDNTTVLAGYIACP